MTEVLPGRADRAYLPLVGAVTAATCLAVLAGAGNVGLAVAPVLLAAVAWAVGRLPLRFAVSGLVLLVLVLDNPQERPAAGQWQSPLYGLGSLLFENLSKTTGIDALRVAPLDLLLLGLAVLAISRGARDQAAGQGTRSVPALTRALVLALTGVAIAEVWGLARGGDFKSSLWQVRQVAAVPVLALLFLAAYRDEAQIRIVARIAVAAAVFKTFEGLYFHEVICRPLGYKPPYVTTHSDTVLFTLVAVMAAAWWHEHEKPTRASRLTLLLVGPLMAIAVYLNGRRLAYVILAAAAAAIYLLVPWTALKRLATRAAIVAVPVAALYLLAGWNQTGGVFRPAQLVKSVVSSEADRSTQTRDIENFNLVMTLRSNPLLGAGFGHEYLEVSKADDISGFFAQYRLIPHNSVLGLWAFAGLLGFWLVWLPIVVGVFLAVRAYRASASPEHRATALVCLATFIAYSLQGYGDMGLQSWEASLLLAAALAASGRLAVAVGAWPTQPQGGSTSQAE